jgi:hypothetical protein
MVNFRIVFVCAILIQLAGIVSSFVEKRLVFEDNAFLVWDVTLEKGQQYLPPQNSIDFFAYILEGNTTLSGVSSEYLEYFEVGNYITSDGAFKSGIQNSGSSK